VKTYPDWIPASNPNACEYCRYFKTKTTLANEILGVCKHPEQYPLNVTNEDTCEKFEMVG